MGNLLCMGLFLRICLMPSPRMLHDERKEFKPQRFLSRQKKKEALEGKGFTLSAKMIER